MITPILLTEVTLPDLHPRAGELCPVYGFVIAHEAGPVLVDTGVGLGHDRLDELYHPRHHDFDAALERVGVSAGEIVMVINSHLHIDHCGNNRRFPGVPLVAQRLEHELALKGGHTVVEWVDFPKANWRLIDGAAELLPGLTVLPTPGHTAGHQSVVVATQNGTSVIAAQAVYDPGEFESGSSIEPLPPEDALATEASVASLKALEPQRVYFSHDPGVWPPS